MSTSNKLTYLNGTKTKLKNAINLTGASITNDTFRQYPDKLYNKFLDILKNGTSTLKANMPRVTGTGTELTLNNTSDLGMDLSLSASESTQFTTTGKNLLNMNLVTSTQNGVTATNNGDGTITLNGTCTTDNTTFSISNDMTLNGTYTLSYEHLDGSYSNTGNASPQVFFLPTTTWVGIGVNLKSNQSNSYTTTLNNLTLNWNKIRVDSGVTFNNYKIRIQLEQGSTATDYEPYTGSIPSPSPDFPQNVNVVTGENSVKIQNKNLLPINDGTVAINGLTFTIENGILTINGTNSASCTVKITNGLDTENGNTLDSNWHNEKVIENLNNTTLSFSVSGTAPSSNWALRLYDDNEERLYSYTYSNLSTSKIYTSNQKVSFICLYFNANLTFNNFKISLQLEKGTSATSFIKPQAQTYSLTLGNLELAKIGTYEDKIFKNVSSSPYYDSSLTTDGWYKYKCIYKYIVTGTENFANTYGENLFGVTDAFNSNPFVVGYGMSNYYRYNSIQSGINSATQMGEFALQKVQSTYSSYNLFFKNTDYSNISDFKTYLQQLYSNNTPVVIYFPLATPTTEAITDTTLVSELEALANATSYDNQTNISQTNANRPFVISASAIKNSME